MLLYFKTNFYFSSIIMKKAYLVIIYQINFFRYFFAD